MLNELYGIIQMIFSLYCSETTFTLIVSKPSYENPAWGGGQSASSETHGERCHHLGAKRRDQADSTASPM